MKKAFAILLFSFLLTSARATTNVLFFLWDSLGQEPSAADQVPAIYILPNATWGKTNLSHSGFAFSQLQDHLGDAGNFYANWNASASNWVYVLEGINCMVGGSNAVETWTAASNLCTELKTHTNWVGLLTTPIPRSCNTTQSNVLYDYDHMILTNHPFANQVFDVGGIATLNPFDFPDNYEPDGTHWSASGTPIVSSYLEAQFSPPAPFVRYFGHR